MNEPEHTLARSRLELRRQTVSWKSGADATGDVGGPPAGPFLAQARANADSAKLTPSNRLKFPKRLFLRFVRFFTERQTAFNRSVVQGLDALSDALGRQARRIGALEADRTRIEFLEQREREAGDSVARMEEELRDLRFRSLALSRSVTGSEASAAEEWDARGLHHGRFAELYSRFQDEFRGTPEDLQARMGSYVSRVQEGVSSNPPLPFLDLGCGRGEFVSALREEGVLAEGVDANPDLVSECRKSGVPVVENDLFAELAARADGSLSGVSAIQVVEHFDVEALLQFLELARLKIAAGGLLLLETIDVSCLYAMRWYFADPTHRLPLMPETLSFYVRASGFEEISCMPLHPVSQDIGGSMEERDALHDVVFGNQDFALFARRPNAGSTHSEAPGVGRRARHEGPNES